MNIKTVLIYSDLELRRMDRIDVGFLGYGTRALDSLMADKRFKVKYFLTPKSRLCSDVYNAAERYKADLRLEIIKNKGELLERIKQIKDVRLFVMNACPFILTEEILENMDFYNIHPGDLKTNRGHHPHLWSVLLQEKETKICMHKVCKEIDLGQVVSEVRVPLNGDENALQVLDKAEDEIPLLLEDLYNLVMGKGDFIYEIKDGIYRRNLTYSDYEIKENDGILDIDRKIRARSMHSGAFFTTLGSRVYVDKITSVKDKDGEGFLYEGNRAVCFREGKMLEFDVKKITDFSGNVIWSR